MCDLSHLSRNDLLSKKSPMSSSNAQGQRSRSTPGSGITGGYNDNSLVIKAVIAVFAGLSIYNAIELIALVFITFTRHKDVYFWSLLTASWGIIPYTLGFLLKFFEVTTNWDKYISVSLLTIGWVVHNGYWPEHRAMESTTSARDWCGRCEDHHRRNHPSCADNCTYLWL